MANLATLTVARDGPMHGAELGRDALATVVAVRSDRTSEVFRQLQAAAAPRGKLAAVRELNQDVRRLALS
jgi:hypothetical protein